MKKLIVFAIVFFVSSSLHAQQALQMISYQGMVQGVNGAPVRDSIYPIAVSFWTDATGGNRLWRDVFQTTVTGGVFNIQLGSGNPLPSPQDMDRPLWISISFNGGEEALPRSPLSAVPTALNVADSSITTAKLADRSVTWNKMGTDYVPYIRVNGAKVNTGQNSINFTGGNGLRVDYDSNSMSVIIHSDSGGADANKGGNNKTLNANGTIYWGETGNYLVDPATGHFLGTTGDTAFEIHVNNGGDTNEGYGRVMRFEPNDSSADIIAGWNAGSVGGNHDAFGSYGAVIAGGGSHGHANVITSATFSTIGGGDSNNIYSGDGGTIAGGEDGAVSGYNATVGGGINNSAGSGDGSQRHQTVGGGNDNTASGDDAAIAGGESNIANGDHSEVSGGFDNTSSGTGSAVGGGEHNTASGNHAAIVAGENNTASGRFSSILGGQQLILGDSSVGFNGSTSGTATNLSGFPSIAYLGNVDLWLGNVDNNAAALRFYEPNLSYTYSSGAHYSSFQADTQTSNIIYTLPSHVPTAGQFLKAATVTGSTNVGLSWDAVTGSGGGSAGWLLTGNAGTVPGTNYLGTQDSAAFEIHVLDTAGSTGGNKRVMRYSFGANSPNILGGSSGNVLDTGLSGAAILSGGVKTGGNSENSNFSVIAGGNAISILDSSDYSGIVGGIGNSISRLSSESGIGFGEANLIDSYSDHSVIGGGLNNHISAPFCFIGGGGGTLFGGPSGTTMSLPAMSAMRSARSSRMSEGGYEIYHYYSNQTAAPWATIGGGYGNYVVDTAGSILGGSSNTNSSNFATIGGGYSNFLDVSSENSIIGGGASNYLWGPASTLGGGYSNGITDTGSALLGGAQNYVSSNYSALGGGLNNSISSPFAFLGGGYNNTLDNGGDTSVLVGGGNNYLTGLYSVLVGGTSDTILSSYAFVGGGQVNKIDVNSDHSVIGGGDSNLVQSNFSSLGGGQGNKIDINSDHSVLVGGESNLVQSNFSALGGGQGNSMGKNSDHSVIAGGNNNYVNAPHATIGGGIGNSIVANDTITDIHFVTDTIPAGSVIAGGDTNTIRAPLSTIGGGSGNLIQLQSIGWCPCSAPASVGTIAGGIDDTIGYLDARWGLGFLVHDDPYASPIMASIGGGWKNTVNGSYGTVGGGYKNHALGLGSTIPGGVGLEALDFQTAVGRYNSNPSYTAQLAHYYSPSADTLYGIGDEVTFMVGNGISADSALRSNAFEVTDSGASIVFQKHQANILGFPASSPVYGGRYDDNTNAAWGEIPFLNVFPFTLKPVPHSFGVDSVMVVGTGQYNVFLHLNDSRGNPITLNSGSVTVTVEGNVCDFATATMVVGNMFTVFIHKMGSSCDPDPQPFMFQVYGRQTP